MNFIRRKRWIIVSMMLVVVVALTLSLTGASAASSSQSTGNNKDEITYTVEISGVGNYEYLNVEVPESLVQVIEFQDGADLILRKRPGRTSCTNMILTSDPSNPALFDIYYDWFDNVKNGQYDRRSALITLLDSDGLEIIRYNAMGTWPTEWRTVVQEDNEVVIEIELVVEQLFLMPTATP
ncbi:phage tail protein [Chloroflexota bacterium]